MRGRFLGADGGRWWLAPLWEAGTGARFGASVSAAPPAGAVAPPPGSLVALEAGRVTVLAVPARPFPDPTSDWARFHGDGGAKGQALVARAALLRAVRRHLDGEGFLEVETPALVPNPGLDLHLTPYAVDGDGGWLSTSPELALKRLVAGGFGRVFEVARVFRRGEEGPLHEPEFTLLEWARAFADVDAVMDDTEALVVAAARALRGTTSWTRADGATLDLTPPWPRFAMREAFARFAGVSMDEVLPDEARFYRVLLEAVEPALARLGTPAFLTRWPASMASLARLCPDDPTVAERVESYALGVELSNGFGELTDPVEQRARFERDLAARRARGLAAPPVDERFLAALEDGLPPMAGNALGLDRLLALLLDAPAIDAVLAFPKARLRPAPG